MGRLILISILALMTASCAKGNSDLDRKEAADLLNKSSLFSPGISYSRELQVQTGGKPMEGCVWPQGQRLFPRIVNTVTGIAVVAENTRRVEFTWDWDAPEGSPLSKCLLGHVEGMAGTPGGVAEFQRYDDGWRVVAVDAKGL
jgi:hypothetical protein